MLLNKELIVGLIEEKKYMKFDKIYDICKALNYAPKCRTKYNVSTVTDIISIDVTVTNINYYFRILKTLHSIQ